METASTLLIIIRHLVEAHIGQGIQEWTKNIRTLSGPSKICWRYTFKNLSLPHILSHDLKLFIWFIKNT